MIEQARQYVESFSPLVQSIKTMILSNLSADEGSLSAANGIRFVPQVSACLASRRLEGLPFPEDFSTDPAQISQIKKIFNAVYYLEDAIKLVRDASTLGLFTTVPLQVYSHISNACKLLTHLDLDLTDAFANEIAMLLPSVIEFQKHILVFKDRALTAVSAADVPTLSRQVGVAAGTVIDQINPHRPQVDYQRLTQFGGDLPRYLDQLSVQIQALASTVSAGESSLNEQRLAELKDNGVQLLQALERMRSNNSLLPLPLPLEALRCIHVIQHTISLSLSIYEQTGHVKDSSQTAIRQALAELKYKLLPSLFGFMDKVEVETLLQPGTLSKPMMTSLSGLYNSLIGYVEKFVDFSKPEKDPLIVGRITSDGGVALKTIEDSAFVDLRFDISDERVIHHDQFLRKIAVAEEAANIFFNRINQLDCKPILARAAQEIRTQLIAQYQHIRPYVLQCDIAWDDKMVGALLGTEEAPILGVTELKDLLTKRLIKLRETRQFKVDLDRTLVQANARDITNICLFQRANDRAPHLINEANYLKNIYVDENARMRTPIGVLTLAQMTQCQQNDQAIARLAPLATAHARIANLDTLPHQELVNLSTYYGKQRLRIARAQIAYEEYQRLITADGFDARQEGMKQKLSNLYYLFQPYIDSQLPGAAEILRMDKNIVEALSKDIEHFGPEDGQDWAPRQLIALGPSIVAYLSAEKSSVDARYAQLETALRPSIQRANQDKPFIQSPELVHRATYLIKHQNYSRTINDFKTALSRPMALLNSALHAQVSPAALGLPFPELDNPTKILEQSSQALMVKRLYNAVYHLHEFSLCLEQINDASLPGYYERNLLNTFTHAQKALYLLQELLASPDIKMIFADLRGHWDNAYGILNALSRSYLSESPNAVPAEPLLIDAAVVPAGTDAVRPSDPRSSSLYLPINALMVLPEHIAKLRRSELALSQEERESLAQHAAKITADIDRMIENRGAYFKLFLEIPTVFELFREFKEQLMAITRVSHGAVMENLSSINDEFIAKILIEADRIEDRLSLCSGTLSKPLKSMLDAFYDGLLEPLGLQSEERIRLISSFVPLDKRINAARVRVEKASEAQRDIQEKQVSLQDLCRQIEVYQAYKRSANPQPGVIDSNKGILIEYYQKALPHLKALDPQILSLLQQQNFSPEIDSLLNTGADTNPPVVNIIGLALAGISQYKGLYASQQLAKGAAEEKIRHLESLRVEKATDNIRFRQTYTESSFDRQAALLIKKPLGLAHLQGDYQSAFKQYLGLQKEAIVLAAKETVDIDSTIKTTLERHWATFEHESYKNYVQLEKFKKAILDFNAYIEGAQRSAFEDGETLIEKTTIRNRLSAIVDNAAEPVAQRLAKLAQVVRAPQFKSKMTRLPQHHESTFAWLQNLVAYMLQLTGLYVPARQHIQQLSCAVVGPSDAEIARLAKKFGLFSAPRIEGPPAIAAMPADAPLPPAA